MTGCAAKRLAAARASRGRHATPRREVVDQRSQPRSAHELLWDALGQSLRPGYRLLPAQAGLHVAVVAPELPPDRLVWSFLQSRDLQVGSLRLTYHFTDPSAGFLVGFGALPTQLVRTACRAFAQALAQVEERHLSE